jgi:hypothetical protein
LCSCDEDRVWWESLALVDVVVAVMVHMVGKVVEGVNLHLVVKESNLVVLQGAKEIQVCK